MTTLAPLLETFFTDRLQTQRRASPNTIAAYSDTFRLLLDFAQQRLKKAPSALLLDDIHADFVGAFLSDLETTRGNRPRTRNARLAAIRSFFRYVAMQEPAHSALIQRVLSIPQKRFDRRLICYLTSPEVDAMLAAPDRSLWIGRRDHALLVTAIQTGLRNAELTALRIEDVVLGSGPHVRCLGKGRKERCTPLTRQTVAVLRCWIREREADPHAPIFLSRRGGALSHDAVGLLVAKYADRASRVCPSIREKRVTPHVLRHTTAVNLLQAGVDLAVIALWLGHESIETTKIYLEADLSIKEKALSRTAQPDVSPGRYRPNDQLMSFLQSL